MWSSQLDIPRTTLSSRLLEVWKWQWQWYSVCPAWFLDSWFLKSVCISSPSLSCCPAFSSETYHNAFNRSDCSHLHPFPAVRPGYALPPLDRGVELGNGLLTPFYWWGTIGWGHLRANPLVGEFWSIPPSSLDLSPSFIGKISSISIIG